MTKPPIDNTAEVPIWQGRRGLINTALCLLLSLPCAYGLWAFAERSVIVPACTAYASAHGMMYTDFKLSGVKHASSVVCLLTKANGGNQNIHLSDLVSFFTNLWVGYAMTLEITVPAFAILLALLRVGLYRRSSQGAESVAAGDAASRRI